MQRRVTQIEAIRVLAMAGIFFYHLWSVLPEGGVKNPFGPLLGAILAQGYLGVVVFNAITGFVLTLPHAGPDGKPGMPVATFFRRRFGRIVPQYYVSLGLWTVVALLAGSMPLMALAACVAEKLIFVQTFDPQRFFSLVPALWWMGLLAQFYLFFPLVLRLFDRWGTGATTVFFLVVCWGLWYGLSLAAKTHTTAGLFDYMLYFNLPYRLPEFVLGMAFARIWKERTATGELPRGWGLGFGILAAGGLALSIAFKDALPMPFAHILLTATCIGVAGSLFTCPAMARWGARPRITAAAAASYSFYLLHQPLLGYGADLIRSRMAPFTAMIVLGLVSLPLSYALAVLQDRIVAVFQTKK